jgi:uncharacterized protein YndB with AHSA1/START domain
VTSTTETQAQTETTTVQVYRVYIKATPEKIWEAITTPEFSEKYGYRGRTEYDLRPGGSYKAFATEDMKAMGGPDVMVDGEVLEIDPPHRLVQTYRFLWDPEIVAEGFTRVTWEIEKETGGLCKLTVTHDVSNAPKHAAMVVGIGPLEQGGGGWPWILSDLKSLLETGSSLFD